ncbi:hypothetical protein [Limosilactobacillus ingluviei]|uniref:Uncharacterized protein n=1 Tax=Limosilactobacillus ingluviei DSM 15946 TaxID=1423760 RepID=A0A0R1UFW3_9LACO|nr:hypothetical protein [Limosilactobacillus ingluviei]KRL89987.1 hypothetical protein FC43_GL001435 [Limosilactobacillus ingluviei DSM 15946]
MKNDLDFDLSDIQTMNETQTGLLAALADMVDEVLDPIDGKEWLNKGEQAMLVASTLRNQQAIKALLRCLKSTTKDQADKLEATYQKYVEGAE